MISINRPAKDPNHRVLSTGAAERYVFISRIENSPSLIVIHIWSDAYVVKDHLYLYAESLTKMDIYNDPVDKISLSLKQKKTSPSSWVLPKNIHLFIRQVSYVYNSFIICYMRQKRRNGKRNCISMGEIMMWKTRQGFSRMTLYTNWNWKGCSAAW